MGPLLEITLEAGSQGSVVRSKDGVDQAHDRIRMPEYGTGGYRPLSQITLESGIDDSGYISRLYGNGQAEECGENECSRELSHVGCFYLLWRMLFRITQPDV